MKLYQGVSFRHPTTHQCILLLEHHSMYVFGSDPLTIQDTNELTSLPRSNPSDPFFFRTVDMAPYSDRRSLTSPFSHAMPLSVASPSHPASDPLLYLHPSPSLYPAPYPSEAYPLSGSPFGVMEAGLESPFQRSFPPPLQRRTPRADALAHTAGSSSTAEVQDSGEGEAERALGNAGYDARKFPASQGAMNPMAMKNPSVNHLSMNHPSMNHPSMNHPALNPSLNPAIGYSRSQLLSPSGAQPQSSALPSALPQSLRVALPPPNAPSTLSTLSTASTISTVSPSSSTPASPGSTPANPSSNHAPNGPSGPNGPSNPPIPPSPSPYPSVPPSVPSSVPSSGLSVRRGRGKKSLHVSPPFSLPHPQSGLQETLEIDLARLDPARRTLMIRNIPNR